MKQSTINRIQIVKDAQQIERRVVTVTYNYVYIYGQRIGQALMNALHHAYPELYDILSGTENDCFYDNSKVSAALAELGFNEREFRKVLTYSA